MFDSENITTNFEDDIVYTTIPFSEEITTLVSSSGTNISTPVTLENLNSLIKKKFKAVFKAFGNISTCQVNNNLMNETNLDVKKIFEEITSNPDNYLDIAIFSFLIIIFITQLSFIANSLRKKRSRAFID